MPNGMPFYKKQIGKMVGMSQKASGIDVKPDPERPARIHSLMCEIRALIDHMAFKSIQAQKAKENEDEKSEISGV